MFNPKSAWNLFAFNSIFRVIYRSWKRKRAELWGIAISLLVIVLQWSFPSLAVAPVNAVDCQANAGVESCLATESLTDSRFAQSLFAQSPSIVPLDAAPDPEPVALPKQRIADQVARTPLDAPFGFLNLFIIFFVTLGPIKVVPTFVQLTQAADRSLRYQLAFRSSALATIVILLVVIIGQNMVRVWQIRLPALLIAGGILLFLVALNLVMTQYEPPPPPPSSDPPSLKLAVTPLTFPTILPPFGIAIALVMMLISQEIGLNAWFVFGALLLVMLLNFICMLLARPIFRFLKPVTLRILGFVLGVLQLALGIEWIINGLEIEALVFRRLFGF